MATCRVKMTDIEYRAADRHRDAGRSVRRLHEHLFVQSTTHRLLSSDPPVRLVWGEQAVDRPGTLRRHVHI